MKTTKYGLRVKSGKYNGHLLSWFARPACREDSDYGHPLEYSLEVLPNPIPDTIWMVDNRAIAEKAAVTDTSWWNADYNTPINSLAGNCEVVEITIEVP